MRLAGLFLLVAVSCLAQDVYQRGAEVFKKSCAQGYCHGSAGAQGRAPRLTGRNFDTAAVAKIINDGVAGTGMPAFRNLLPADQRESVIAYVVKISGGAFDAAALTGSAQGSPTQLPAAAAKGKDLFFEATRGIHRCGTCHSLEGIGTAIGPNLATGSTAGDDVMVAAIRRGNPAGVRSATLGGGEQFPALVAEQGADSIQIYDLGAMPPVLRTVAKGSVKLSSGSGGWSHSNAVKNYSDADLRTIGAYLRHLAGQ